MVFLLYLSYTCTISLPYSLQFLLAYYIYPMSFSVVFLFFLFIFSHSFVRQFVFLFISYTHKYSIPENQLSTDSYHKNVWKMFWHFCLPIIIIFITAPFSHLICSNISYLCSNISYFCLSKYFERDLFIVCLRFF